MDLRNAGMRCEWLQRSLIVFVGGYRDDWAADPAIDEDKYAERNNSNVRGQSI